MDSFRRLSTASILASLALVTIGGLVRATKSGLGCGTDWPHCSGRLVPALENRAVMIEYSHRLAATLVVVLLAALAWSAWRHHRSSPRILWASTGAFALVLFQAVLGAVVVKLELEAASVVLHLATAMALVAVLVYITAAAQAVQRRLATATDPATARAAAAAAGLVLLQLVVGSYVSGRGAGLAFPDWPLMNGRVLPGLGGELHAIQFLHRALALVAGIAVAGVGVRVIRRRAVMPLQARLGHVAMGAFGLEVLVGAANVWSRLNAVAVTAHLLLGALIWASVVGIAVVSGPVVAEVADDREPRRATAAMETAS